MTEYLGATKKRKEQAAVIREMLIERGIAFMRNRVKPMLTSWPIRCRGNKRKWTKLDKALTDGQAYALDRAFNAWLITAGKSKSVDPGAAHVAGGSSDGPPLSSTERYEVARYSAAIRDWPSSLRQKLETLFQLMAPWAEKQNVTPDAASIAQIVELAKKLEKIY